MTAIFEPAKMVPVAELCERGVIPMCGVTARRLAAADKLPAVKIGGVWHSTPEMVRSWLYKGANKAARRMLA
jgi:hypothetical protein